MGIANAFASNAVALGKGFLEIGFLCCASVCRFRTNNEYFLYAPKVVGRESNGECYGKGNEEDDCWRCR